MKSVVHKCVSVTAITLLHSQGIQGDGSSSSVAKLPWNTKRSV